MANLTITFREKTLANLANFLVDNSDFADVYTTLKTQVDAVATLEGPPLPVSVTLDSDRATALFQLISSTLANLTAIPEQSDAWQMLNMALNPTPIS